MRFKPWTVGLFQATGLTIYVSVFSVLAAAFRDYLIARAITPLPAVVIVIFLLAFIISAIISSSIIFGYPAFLFMEGMRREAATCVFWSVIWLLVFFTIFIVLTAAVGA